MSRLLLGTLVLGLVLLTTAVPGATPVRDSEQSVAEPFHPYVGVALFGSNGSISHTCSGAMLSPRIFLTAGHCTAGADVVLVWVEVGGPFEVSTAIAGQPLTHPGFDGFAAYPDSRDLGVVLLDDPVDLPSYASLPAPGALDGLLTETGSQPTFTAVGFGLQRVVPFMQEGYSRLVSVPLLVTLGDPPTDGFNLHLGISPPRRYADAACMGDGGRPVFLGDSNVVAGIASLLNSATCGGSGFYFRLDTPFAQEFIRGVLQ